jgi:hypothetical protein
MRSLTALILGVVLILTVLSTHAVDESSELQEKVAFLTAENQRLKRDKQRTIVTKDHAALSEPDQDKEKDLGDYHVTIGAGVKFADGDKIDLDKIDGAADIRCPAGSPEGSGTPHETQWIRKITVNTINDGDSNEDYLGSGEKYEPFHFTINRDGHGDNVVFGNSRNNAKKVYWDANRNIQVNENYRTWFPSTVAVMWKQGDKGGTDDEKDYFDGKFMKSSKKNDFSDFEQTMYWKIEGGKCYAMAAYVGIKTEPSSNFNERFKSGETDSFAKAAYLRILKFAVCKAPSENAAVKCASETAVVSCWYKLSSGSYERCSATDRFAATILARA